MVLFFGWGGGLVLCFFLVVTNINHTARKAIPTETITKWSSSTTTPVWKQTIRSFNSYAWTNAPLEASYTRLAKGPDDKGTVTVFCFQ